MQSGWEGGKQGHHVLRVSAQTRSDVPGPGARSGPVGEAPWPRRGCGARRGRDAGERTSGGLDPSPGASQPSGLRGLPEPLFLRCSRGWCLVYFPARTYPALCESRRRPKALVEPQTHVNRRVAVTAPLVVPLADTWRWDGGKFNSSRSPKLEIRPPKGTSCLLGNTADLADPDVPSGCIKGSS